MTYPVVVEDVITHDVEDLKACIYEMFQNLNNENDTVAWGIWVEGEEDIALRAKLINDPIKGEKDLLSWQKRNFGDKKFGIILNRAQRYSEKLRNVISNYFKPFLDEKTPFGGDQFFSIYG